MFDIESIKAEMILFKSIMKAIAAQFGERCEIVLHDLTGDYDSSIIAIENGHLTGRKVGDCGSNLGLEVLRGTVKDGDRYNYITQTKDGKTLRSSSIYIKNEEGKVIGSLCINLDISDYIFAENTMKSLTMSNLNNDVKEVFANDVNELLDSLLQESQNKVGKAVCNMTREDKVNAIKFLDEKGAFLISKAGNKICEYFDISKFTLYNYLDESRQVTPE